MNKLRLQKRKLTNPIFWAQWGVVSAFLARQISPIDPPILILSIPRSGSSWTGEILGHAAEALYLREPITQSNIAAGQAQGAIIDIDPSNPPVIYQYFADTAFSGWPIFKTNIVRDPDQWSLFSRSFRRLVIKEVNPLACEWFIQRYQPRIIFLVRHPAAVALSYLKLGWTKLRTNELFTPRLINNDLHPWKQTIRSVSDFWTHEGIRQGAILYLALKSLQNYPDKKIICYEDLCSNSVSCFRNLFEFADLQWNDGVEGLIKKNTSNNEDHPYGTSRVSNRMIHKWRNEIRQEDLRRLQLSFGLFELSLYGNDEDWF